MTLARVVPSASFWALVDRLETLGCDRPAARRIAMFVEDLADWVGARPC